jgi:filamentous hemagglutinin family protein
MKNLAFILSCAALTAGGLIPVAGNPVGGQVTSGAASITTIPGTVTINQSTNTAIINWQSFSINAGELTRFQVPAVTSATLNRVTGGNASLIYGSLQSNGQVYLINPNGIEIGPSGRIDTAGFIGSTLDVSDADFNKQQNLNFFGSSNAAVNNQGKIHARNGDVYLIATQVSNSGKITARHGTVGLAAGSQVLYQNAGDQHLFVQGGPSSGTAQAVGVQNTGTIRAAAAELKAAGGNAYALAINNSGNIAATGIAKINGQVYLTAPGSDIVNSGTISAKQANGDGGNVVINAHSSPGGTTTGTVQNSGKIVASGKSSAASVGGTVQLLGDRVALTGNASVDVSGNAGGGTVLVGGDEHGANPDIPDALQTYLGPGASIDADALLSGNGGKVILWGNQSTQVYGSLSVRGGAQSGNGGFVETSGGYLDARTVPDLTAPNGVGGTWLLDPYDLNIVPTDGGSSSISGSNDDSGNTYFTSNDSDAPSILNVGDIATALATGSVQINATADSDSSINWESGANLYYGSIASGTLNLTLVATGVISLDGVTIANVPSGTPTSTALNLNFYPDQYGVLRIMDGTTINLNGGSLNAVASINPANVSHDFGEAPPSAVYISDSTITTGGSGSVYIEGTGVSGAGMDAVGVEIEGSTFNIGTADAPSTGSFYIHGTSDSGSNSTSSTLSSSAPSAYGVLIDGNSFFTDYGSAISNFAIHGESFAGNNSSAVGTVIDASTVESYNGHLSIKGHVTAENINGEANGLANRIAGVVLDDGTLVQSFGNIDSSHVAGLSISGDIGQSTTASDGGDTTISPESVGVLINNDSQITSDGDTTFLSLPISIEGEAGAAQTTSGNSNIALASGVVIFGDSNSSIVTVSNSGLGAIAIAGVGGRASGANVIADGVDILGNASNEIEEDIVVNDVAEVSGPFENVIVCTGGGSIGIAGLGGEIDSDPESLSFTGQADGIAIGSYNFNQDGTSITSSAAGIGTTSGSIFLFAAAGDLAPDASLPDSTSLDLTGLELESGTLSTDLSTPEDAPAVPNGGVFPPSILIYATNSTVGPRTGHATFQLGSSSGNSIYEDSNSELYTGNLILGNYYNALTAYAPPADVAKLPTVAAFASFLNQEAGTISSDNITINPVGAISLTSTLNQIGDLDSALVGAGGLNLYDSSSLVINSIGASDNADFGSVDEAAMGPVTIQSAGNLTLTLTSPLSGTLMSVPVISTSGSGNNITLVTGGVFTNEDYGYTAGLSATGGAVYVVYSNISANDEEGNLTNFSTIFNTSYTGTPLTQPGNLLVFSGPMGPINTMGPPSMMGIGMDTPGNPMSPIVPIQDSLDDIPPPNPGGQNPFVTPTSGDTLTTGTGVAGGAGGVDITGKQADELADLKAKLAALYGPTVAGEFLQIIENDFADGSPVNTGSLLDKWASNSGFSESVRPGELAQLGFGQATPYRQDPFVINQFQNVSNDSILNLLSAAAFGQ